MTQPPGPPRDRRAVDGLDWRDPAPPSPPPPGAVTPLPPPPAAARLPMIALVAVASALVGGLIAGGAVLLFGDDDLDTPDAAAPSGPQVTTIEQTSAITEVAERVRPSIVRLESTRESDGRTVQDVGSGVLLDAEGHVLTNAHVVLGTQTLQAVLADGSERPAILVGHDFPYTDLAVVQIGPANLAPIDVGDSAALKLGETVIAIGNPLAEFDGSVTAGIVSGLNRVRTFDGVVQPDLIQTDAAINSGNSGGALLNLRGQFIGMPTSVIRQASSGATVEGIAFALPSNRILTIARGIIANSGNYPRATLAIDTVNITPDVLTTNPRLAASQGALVTGVPSGGAAANAGIVAGDIITRIGDLDITTDRPLLNAIMEQPPGGRVPVVLNRGGRIIETEVQLDTRA